MYGFEALTFNMKDGYLGARPCPRAPGPAARRLAP